MDEAIHEMDTMDEGNVEDVAVEAAVKETGRATRASRRNVRPSSRQEGKTTGLSEDIAEDDRKTPITGTDGDEKPATPEDDDRSKKKSPVVMECDDGGEEESLMENIKKQRKSTIVGHFPKASHTVAIKPPAKRQRTSSSVSKDVEIVDENDENKARPAPAQSPSTSLLRSPRPSPSMRQTRATTSAELKAFEERKLAVELGRYCQRGEKLLIEAACEAPEIDMLPQLYHPREHDYILINVDSLYSDPNIPPKPHPFGERGDTKYNHKDFVSLPWDEQHVSRDGIHLYAVIERELKQAVQEGFASMGDVKTLLQRVYCPSNITALKEYYNVLDSERRRTAFFEVIRGIAELALRGKELFPGSLPVCDTPEGSKKECSVTLSQEQCACLLACAFFGIFPEIRRRRFNDFNMVALFSEDTPLTSEKLRFIISYFSQVLTTMPTGVVSFRRCAISITESKRLLENESVLSEVGISKEPIEKCHHALQVDFANKHIGGGVLYTGAVQEEIRFLCCPEMIVSLLLCPQMKDNEAVFIVGAQQYSSYTGYADTLAFEMLQVNENQERDKFRRIRCQVVAMDAINSGGLNKGNQFRDENIKRELTKALVGFKTENSDTMCSIPVATGNWGCGAFNGDIQLKCIIQLIAASVTGRPIVYCPFTEQKTAVEFCYLRDRLVGVGISSTALLAKVREYRYHSTFSLFAFLKQFVERGY